jgi:mono/diheme cytochrome c family protein
MKEARDYLGNPLGPDELRRCLGCHATDPHAARDGIGPVAADRGIGCERCHGPGSHHLTAVAWKLSDLAIGRPGRVTPAESTKLCAQCHSPRGRSPVPPGDPAEIRFQALTMPRSRCFTESRGAFGCVTCHNPHRDADTDPSYYETRCLACHGPAGSSARAAGRVSLPEEVRRVACPVEPVANCLACHMPQVKAAVPHTVFTDHHIRVHRETMAAGAE